MIGTGPTMKKAYASIRPGGVCTIVGSNLRAKLEIEPFTLLYERRIQGSNYGTCKPTTDLPMLVDLYMAGKIKLDELISRRVQLDEVNDAIASVRRSEVARTVIVN